MRVKWTIENSLKAGETEKRVGETKIFKGGGKLGQGMGALKRGAATPLRTMYTLIDFILDIVTEFKLKISNPLI